MKHVFISFLTIAALLSSRCTAPYNGENAVIQGNIPTEFQFEVLEYDLVTAAANPLKLNITTLQEKDCGNAALKHATTTNNGQIMVNLLDITKPEVCAGKGIMSNDIALGSLGNGTYNLQIRLKDAPVVTLGTLNISDEFLQVNMLREAGIKAAQLKTNRIPKTAIWGVITYEDSHSRNLANELKNELRKERGAHLLNPGHYSLFDITENQQITLRSTSNNNNEFFAFSLSDTKNLKKLINEYKDEGLKIVVFTGGGETWR
jgi:hypothetical protein